MKKCCFFLITGLFLSASSALADNSELTKEFKPKIEIAYFEPKDSDSQGSLGISYSLDYNLKINDPLKESLDTPQPISERSNFFNLNLYSKGNIPFKSNFLIGDFIETGVDFAWESIKLGSLQKKCDDDFCSEEVQDNSFIFKLAGNYQFESDSNFDQQQHAYGVKTRIVYKTPSNSTLRYFNPLEWVPSFVKMLVGDGFKISDSKRVTAPKPFNEAYLPSLLLAVEQVDPVENEKRKFIDTDLEKYERFRADISYSSTLFKVEDDVYRTSFTWRYFKEISADEDIRYADLDEYNYLTIAIHTPQNLVISYSRGQLPFDASSEEMFKVGWGFEF